MEKTNTKNKRRHDLANEVMINFFLSYIFSCAYSAFAMASISSHRSIGTADG